MSITSPSWTADIQRVKGDPSRDTKPRGDTGGEVIYAIGDVHGCYDLMVELLASVVEDAVVQAGLRIPIVIFSGDYIDRGPDSARVVEALTLIQRRADVRLHLLKGNHEQALLGFLEDPKTGAMWLRCGGAETLMSYNVDPPGPESAEADLVVARDALLARMPASHLLFFHRLQLMVTAGDFAFVHAGVRPGVALARQAEHDLLWIRQGFVDAQGPFEKVIVHGHTWVDDQPTLHPHRIGVDTGAYATGVLTAVRLDGGDVGVLQARRSGGQQPVSVPEVVAPVGLAARPSDKTH